MVSVSTPDVLVHVGVELVPAENQLVRRILVVVLGYADGVLLVRAVDRNAGYFSRGELGRGLAAAGGFLPGQHAGHRRQHEQGDRLEHSESQSGRPRRKYCDSTSRTGDTPVPQTTLTSPAGG